MEGRVTVFNPGPPEESWMIQVSHNPGEGSAFMEHPFGEEDPRYLLANHLSTGPQGHTLEVVIGSYTSPDAPNVHQIASGIIDFPIPVSDTIYTILASHLP
jgi:hypothetical protein